MCKPQSGYLQTWEEILLRVKVCDFVRILLSGLHCVAVLSRISWKTFRLLHTFALVSFTVIALFKDHITDV